MLFCSVKSIICVLAPSKSPEPNEDMNFHVQEVLYNTVMTVRAKHVIHFGAYCLRNRARAHSVHVRFLLSSHLVLSLPAHLSDAPGRADEPVRSRASCLDAWTTLPVEPPVRNAQQLLKYLD